MNEDQIAASKNLYFDRELKEKIPILLQPETTCQDIFNTHEENIKKQILKISPNEKQENINFKHYCFCISELPQNKENKKLLTDLILKPSNIILNYLQSPQYIILFLQIKTKSKNEFRKNARSLFVLQTDIIEDTQKIPISYKIKEYISKTNIYVFDEKENNFYKEKASVDEQKICTLEKNKTTIYLSEVKKDIYINDKDNYYKQNQIKSKEKFSNLIEIYTKDKKFLFGEKKDDFTHAVRNALCLMRSEMVDSELENEIFSARSGLFTKEHLIVENCFSLNEILCNNEKRKIFLSFFKEKNASDLIEQIIMYKSLLQKNQNLESWTNFKQILAYTQSYKETGKSNKEEDVLLEILTKERIEKYNKVSKDANEALQKIMLKKDINENFKDEINKALSDVLKENLFDELYFYLFNIYLEPRYYKIIKNMEDDSGRPNNKSQIRKKFQILLAYYFFKFINMKNKFLYLKRPGDKNAGRGTCSLKRK